jgi:hypothetical protein
MNLKKIITIALFSIGAIACEKSQDFLAENTTPTGAGYAPVSANTLQDVTATPIKNLGTTSAGATAYPAGSTFKTELTFFSQSAVKEINLYNTVGSGTKTLVNSIPYAPAFSNTKRLDTLLVPYTVPTGTAGTVIRLDYEIKNVNSLATTRTAYVRIQ